MTRLISEWVSPMLDGMAEYNRNLEEKIGVDLSGLICGIFDVSEDRLKMARAEVSVAVIPVTQGEGIIGDFAPAVAAIVESMGFRAIVTENTDVDGIYEACEKGCDVLFFADDIRYLALNIADKRTGENNYCTALGYIAVLEKMLENCGKRIDEEKILIIGYGVVGKEAAQILRSRGVSFCVYDKDEHALCGTDFELLENKEDIKNYEFVLDFTNEGNWLRAGDLHADVMYASPGVPCSLDENAKKMLAKNAVYDNLEIGTAVMLGEAVL